jgi:hypothetical protein
MAMHLGKHVVDKELLDRVGLRAGKVDDLLLVLADATNPDAPPQVSAILTGPTALSQNLGWPLRWLVRAVYRLIGLDDPQPATIRWERVTAIDVVVHVDIDRVAAGWSGLGDAVNRRIIQRLPGA